MEFFRISVLMIVAIVVASVGKSKTGIKQTYGKLPGLVIYNSSDFHFTLKLKTCSSLISLRYIYVTLFKSYFLDLTLIY